MEIIEFGVNKIALIGRSGGEAQFREDWPQYAMRRRCRRVKATTLIQVGSETLADRLAGANEMC
jgi:hypothetical protein